MTNKKEDKRLEEYKDSSGLSMKHFRIGLWLSRNRKRIYRLFVYLLVLICLFFFGYSAYRAVEYFQSDSNPGSDNVVFPRQTPTDLRLGQAKALKAAEGYDLIAELENPNDKYIAYFTYCFFQGGEEIACDTSFIFPREQKYLFSLDVSEYDDSRALTISLKDASWQRIDLHKVPDWPVFLSERLAMPVSNTSLKKDSAGFYQLEFSVRNDSSYSYVQVPLSVILFNNGQISGVNRYFLKPFNSGQEKDVRLTWLAPSSNGVDSVQIIPDIDIYSPSSYLKASEF
jgi:hypothetical protein